MKLIVQGKQMRITEGLRRFTEQHVVRPLRRFYDNEAAELRVEVGRDNGNRGESKECHLTFRMPGARTIQIEESTPDLYACLELAAARLVRVAKKELGKRRWSKGRRKQHPLATAVAEGGVPGGLVDDLPNGPALRTVERSVASRRRRKK